MSLPRSGSGEGTIELPVVNPAMFGDMMGEQCELEATDEVLTAEAGGMATSCECGVIEVCTLPGRERLDCTV